MDPKPNSAKLLTRPACKLLGMQCSLAPHGERVNFCPASEGVRVSSFPVLSASDRPFYPADGRCPMCRAEFSHGVAYLWAGALHLTADGKDSLHSHRLRAFLNVGFHGLDPDMRDSSDVSVVADLSGGQFDLSWCSVGCMREWLLALLCEVELLAGSQADRSQSQADAEPGATTDGGA